MLSPGTTTWSVPVVWKYKPQSRQLKWRTSAGFNTDCRARISRKGQRSSTTWNLNNKEYRRGCQPVSPGLQGFQAQLPCWHSVPHPTERLCLCRINPHCERKYLSDATEVDITHFITSWSYTLQPSPDPQWTASIPGSHCHFPPAKSTQRPSPLAHWRTKVAVWQS